MLAIKADSSLEAAAVKSELGIQGYIETTGADFKHTVIMLQKAGVDKSFSFKF